MLEKYMCLLLTKLEFPLCSNGTSMPNRHAGLSHWGLGVGVSVMTTLTTAAPSKHS